MTARVETDSGGFNRLHLDVPLLTGLLLLSGVGLVVLYSAGGNDLNLVGRQAVRLLIGFAVMVLCAQIPPRHLFYWTPWIYVGGVLLLIAVLVMGEFGKGAQRWLRLGPINFQPSEIVKVSVPMMIAYYFADRSLPPGVWRVVTGAIMAGVPAALVAWQPDLGTALLIASSGFFVLFLSGMGWRLMVLAGGVVSACAPLLWLVMHDYQRRRVLTFLDPEVDPLGAGYHIIQSKIAIGSGGFYGKGWLNGTQSQLDFIPERSTDFVFAVFSEEFGFLGAIALLSLYLFVVVRGLYISAQAQDSFGRLVAGGLVLTFFVYVFVNIGMVSGVLPVVGLPLPLISYGGTSLVTVMAAFGILMSVKSHRRLLSD